MAAINKSSRHSKITGDFAERLVLYWLSKYGFECAYVDHVGLDIIANWPQKKERIGISVKSRSRYEGKEREYVKIPIEELMKLEKAAKTFGCVPYFAVVVDEANTISAWLLEKSYLIRLHPPSPTQVSWGMGKKWTDRYSKDPRIRSFVLSTKTTSW